MNLPFGGGKSRIRVNAGELSNAETERLTRRLAHELQPIIGPTQDIAAADMGTNPEVRRGGGFL